MAAIDITNIQETPFLTEFLVAEVSSLALAIEALSLNDNIVHATEISGTEQSFLYRTTTVQSITMVDADDLYKVDTRHPNNLNINLNFTAPVKMGVINHRWTTTTATTAATPTTPPYRGLANNHRHPKPIANASLGVTDLILILLLPLIIIININKARSPAPPFQPQ
ncbi:hypothetical protein FQN51_000660 [Onygenales sp. PD_10]|nr:hypothetical protein FQN51_000660 [Onygenales sp. PD_10]